MRSRKLSPEDSATVRSLVVLQRTFYSLSFQRCQHHMDVNKRLTLNKKENAKNVKKTKFIKKVKADIALYGNPISELYYTTGRNLPYGITQCYLLPDTSERVPPNPSHAGWYSIYLPRRDGRLSWRSWLDSAPAGSRISDLSITSPTPNRCTTKTTISVE